MPNRDNPWRSAFCPATGTEWSHRPKGTCKVSPRLTSFSVSFCRCTPLFYSRQQGIMSASANCLEASCLCWAMTSLAEATSLHTPLPPSSTLETRASEQLTPQIPYIPRLGAARPVILISSLYVSSGSPFLIDDQPFNPSQS